MIESSKQLKEKIRNKSVLLFSGGMDCLCLNQIYKPDILLHIDYGGKYNKSEKKSIDKLIKLKAIDKKKLININIGKWLGNEERKDLIIPNRNIYFVTLASNFGEIIYLASVYGDRSFDKDKKFYKLMINLLNHVWDKQHWTEKRQFKVISPIKDLTKTQLIKKFLQNGGNIKWLLESYSCYEGKNIPCGKCKPCWRKWVALKNNNIEIPKKYYKNNPQNIPWLKEILPKLKKGTYRGKEDKEILKAHNI